MTVLAGAVLVLAFQNRAQAVPLVYDNFPNPDANIGNWYGYDTPVYAAGTDDAGDSGSMYFTDQFSLGGNICTAYDGYAGGNPWYVAKALDFSQYTELDFDVLWDTTSGLTIDQWNTGTNFQASLYTTPEPQNWMAMNGFITGLDILLSGDGNNTTTDLGSVNLPKSAAFGWQTVKIPLSPGVVGGANDESAIIFKKWCSGTSAAPLAATTTGKYWIDNIVLQAGGPPPKPTVSVPQKAVAGLAIFNATAANSFYDRNEVGAVATSGFSWIGHEPATYSYTVASMPQGVGADACYLFIVPNASAVNENGPDYNEPTALVVDTQPLANGGSSTIVTYRVNQPNTEDYTNLMAAPLTSAVQAGTYTLTFTSDSAGYMTVADGTSATFAFPAGANPTVNFAETGATPAPCLLYLGGQANVAAAMDQAVVYTAFSCTGVPSHFSETFTGESALVNFVSTPTHFAAGVVLVKPTDAYWIGWSLPAVGYNLQNRSSMTAGSFANTATYAPITMYGSNVQLVANADLKAPTSSQEFELIQRQYTALLVALPGQTFTSGVGVTGTATGLSGGAPWTETATAYAVDAGNNLVTAINSDQCSLFTTTDTAASDDFVGPSANAVMASGVATFSGATGTFSWGNDDSGNVDNNSEQTVTVTDLSKTITGVSSQVKLSGGG